MTIWDLRFANEGNVSKKMASVHALNGRGREEDRRPWREKDYRDLRMTIWDLRFANEGTLSHKLTKNGDERVIEIAEI